MTSRVAGREVVQVLERVDTQVELRGTHFEGVEELSLDWSGGVLGAGAGVGEAVGVGAGFDDGSVEGEAVDDRGAESRVAGR